MGPGQTLGQVFIPRLHGTRQVSHLSPEPTLTPSPTMHQNYSEFSTGLGFQQEADRAFQGLEVWFATARPPYLSRAPSSASEPGSPSGLLMCSKGNREVGDEKLMCSVSSLSGPQSDLKVNQEKPHDSVVEGIGSEAPRHSFPSCMWPHCDQPPWLWPSPRTG